MQYGFFRAGGWSLASIFLFAASLSQAADTRVLQNPQHWGLASSGATIEERADAFEEALSATFHEEGTRPVLLKLRAMAEGNVDLSPLREHMMKDGEPTEISVKVHSQMAQAVEFANEQLLLSGVDFVRYKADVDDEFMPEPKEPFRREAKSAKRWARTKAFIGPMLGLATTLIENFASMAPGLAQSAREGTTSAAKKAWEQIPTDQVVKGIGLAAAVVGLEVQFALFTSWWNKNVWSKDGRIIPEIPTARLWGHSPSLAVLFDMLNSVTKKVTWAYGLNFVVNCGYAVVGNAVALLALTVYGAIGVIGEDFSWWELGNVLKHGGYNLWNSSGDLIARSFFGTWLFCFAIGFNQVKMAEMKAKGLISEGTRIKVEAIQWYLSAPGRLFSMAGMKALGDKMMLASGALVTVPMFAWNSMIDSYSRRTARLFAANADPEIARASGLCERFASAFTGSRAWNFLRGGTGIEDAGLAK